MDNSARVSLIIIREDNHHNIVYDKAHKPLPNHTKGKIGSKYKPKTTR